MPKRVFKLYQRKRVVNINLNILAAGILAIVLIKFPVMFISKWIGPEHKLLISVIAYVLDTIVDVMVYYALHWIANHWDPNNLKDQSKLPKKRRFIHDATRIQAERMALVPIFMFVAIGGMWAIQEFFSIGASWALIYAFVSAMLITRIIHTFWGYRSGTFKDTVDFMIDDDIQIGRDLSKEAEEQEQEAAESEETDEVTL